MHGALEAVIELLEWSAASYGRFDPTLTQTDYVGGTPACVGSA